MAGDTVARSVSKFIYIRVGGQILRIYPPRGQTLNVVRKLKNLTNKKYKSSKKYKMKKSILVLFILASISAFPQDSKYNVSSYLTEGTKAPNTHYIGEAWLNAIINDDTELGYNITKATFKANSTLDWHKHSTAQVLIIVNGEAYYQERGNEPVILKEGDIIKCEKDIEHWHSSTKYSDVTYLALYGGGQPTTWTEVVTQEYYDDVSKKLKNN